MKKTLIIILSALAFASCDTRVNPLSARNNSPRLLISSELNASSKNDDYVTTLIDSAKVNHLYKIAFDLEEEQILTPLVVSGLDGWMTYRDTAIWEISGLPNTTGEIHYYPETLGSHNLKLTTTDGWGESSESQLTLTVFNNLGPVADIQVDNYGSSSPYERMINAEDSYDRDEAYGGSIHWYQFIIENDTTLYPYDKMPYIFPGTGTYSVGVRVMDSDSTWSAVKSISYNVN